MENFEISWLLMRDILHAFFATLADRTFGILMELLYVFIRRVSNWLECFDDLRI